MAEHASIGNGAAEARMFGTVVPRAHAPTDAALRVPGNRKLDELIVAGSMQITHGALAGADRIVDALFEGISWFVPRASVGAADVISALAAERCKIFPGGGMIVSSALEFRP